MAGARAIVPIRSDPQTPDTLDAERVALVRDRWHSQDEALLEYARTVEENVRMIAGRQWDVWSPLLGRFVDVSRYLSDEERRWRQRPVVNRLQFWFILTHAKLTENGPVLTFQPSTADRRDAMLAESMDTIFKTLWHEVGGVEAIDRMVAWLVAGGQAFVKSRVDFTKGPPVAPQGAEGGPGAPAEPEGELALDVLGPLEARGEWGMRPWHMKQWHIHRSYLTPSEIKDQWGVDVTPDSDGQAPSGSSYGGASVSAVTAQGGGTAGYLERLLFGSGYFGAAMARYGAQQSAGQQARAQEGYVAVDEMWEAPCAAYPETPDSPGGRLLIVCKDRVLADSARPYRLRYTSPIRQFVFVNVPGRPAGSTPVEMLIPIQKTYNRGWAQLLEHRNLMTNPAVVVDAGSGITEEQVTNKPGAIYVATMRPGVDRPIQYVAPPPLSSDVYKVQALLSETMDTLGNIPGSLGGAPTPDPSGELVKELRFNSDRFIGSASRRMVNEIARIAEDWVAILPVVWTTEKVLTYAGEDDVARTLTVLPEMWDGDVNVTPDVESMLPEGRGERQQRIAWMYMQGIFGPPGTPPAAQRYLELSRFPHLSRASRPGGTDAVTARQNLGLLIQGTPAAQVPIFEWYDFGTFLRVTEEYMKAPEYKTLDPATQNEFVAYRQRIQGAAVAKQLQDMRLSGALQMAGAAMAGQVASAAQHAMPQPPPGQGDESDPETESPDDEQMASAGASQSAPPSK